jgi:hypothetical protein
MNKAITLTENRPDLRSRSKRVMEIFQQLSRYGAPHPLQAAPFFPCHTRFVPQRTQTSNLFIVAPQFWHEYFRLPPLAVCSMRSPHSGHAFWSCLMFLESMSVMEIFQQSQRLVSPCDFQKLCGSRSDTLKTGIVYHVGGLERFRSAVRIGLYRFVKMRRGCSLSLRQPRMN